MSIDNVEDITPRVQYVASASQTAFDYPFPIFTDADLVVIVDGVTKTLTTDYTVSGAGADTGGTVTFTSGQTAGAIVTIYRDIAIERTSDYQQNGPLTSAAINDELDRMTLVDQQLESRINRCLRLPIDAAVNDADIELAPLSSWLSKYVYIDSGGTPVPASYTSVPLTQSLFDALLPTTTANLPAARIEYPQTAAETAAGVTPVNFYIPNYTASGEIRPNRLVTNTTPGTTDMTAAINNAMLIAANGGYKKIRLHDGETYLVSSQLTIPCDGLILEGHAKIICASTSDYDYILYALNRTGVEIRHIEFDLNKSARSGIQTHRFLGPTFSGCTDSIFEGLIVRGARGYGGISATGIALGGQTVRCYVQKCTVIDCGDAGFDSDAIYTKGTQNLISECIAKNCTDTAFVIEDSDYSGISACTSDTCGAVAAITLADVTDRAGNFINGLTGKNWNAPSTGGIQVGPLASTGNLRDTNISGVNLFASTAGGYGNGAAIWIRRVGAGTSNVVKMGDININGASYGVRVDDATAVSLADSDIKNVTSAGVMILAGSGHKLKDVDISDSSIGIDVEGTASVTARHCFTSNTTSVGMQALNTSTLTLINSDVLSISSGVRLAKDAGATLNFAGVNNTVTVNAAATYTQTFNDKNIVQTTAASVYTLLDPTLYKGKEILIKTEFAGTVTSASSNVVPLVGGAAGTAILAATAGKWATLQSDGVAWRIIAAN